MDLLSIIATNTYTISDLKRRVRILKEYLEKKLFGGDPQLIKPEDQTWLASLPESLNDLNSKTFYAQIEDLNKKISKLTPLTVYLSFEMPPLEIAKLASSIRTTIKDPTTFLDIKKDPNLIGGASFVFHGIYRDYSLRKTLENQRDQVLMEMRKYVS